MFKLLLLAVALGGTEDRAALMRSYREDARPRAFLLSYPRSGNTWLRFCLEYLTERPTLSFKKDLSDLRPYSAPLGLQIPELTIDLSKPCIWKVHSRGRLEEIDQSYRGKLIFLVRNHRDCLLSDLCDIPRALQVLRDPDAYFYDNFALYEEWDPNERLLVYYEDLFGDPETVLPRILLFLHEPLTRLPQFLSHLDALKACSLSYYRQVMGPRHRPENRRPSAMDRAVQQCRPDIWNTYLHRYAEIDKVPSSLL